MERNHDPWFRCGHWTQGRKIMLIRTVHVCAWTMTSHSVIPMNIGQVSSRQYGVTSSVKARVLGIFCMSSWTLLTRQLSAMPLPSLGSAMGYSYLWFTQEQEETDPMFCTSCSCKYETTTSRALLWTQQTRTAVGSAMRGVKIYSSVYKYMYM